MDNSIPCYYVVFCGHPTQVNKLDNLSSTQNGVMKITDSSICNERTRGYAIIDENIIDSFMNRAYSGGLSLLESNIGQLTKEKDGTFKLIVDYSELLNKN